MDLLSVSSIGHDDALCLFLNCYFLIFSYSFFFSPFMYSSGSRIGKGGKDLRVTYRQQHSFNPEECSTRGYFGPSNVTV